MSDPDVIVVGSGASAVHVAWPLVHAGRKVLMLDVGRRDEHYAPMVPSGSFAQVRRTDAQQHRYFLGDRFEGVPFGPVRVGAQLTPPRAFISRDVQALTPVGSTSFDGMESLARSGLAAGWGAGVARFSDYDLARTPLKAVDLVPHYRAVESRIGIAADDDDLSDLLGRHAEAMPALFPDTSAQAILERYRARASSLRRSGLRMGAARLAACSRTFKGRGPHPMDDMDFWADHAKAVYRPAWTLDELRAHGNFSELPGWLVIRWEESAVGVTVHARRVDGRGEETFRARTLVLAAGVFGTARIVLRSLRQYDRPVPFVCNPSSYCVCLNLNMLGKKAADARHSLSQLSAVLTGSDDPDLFVSVYSYRSLLTFKLMKEMPLSVRSSLRLLRDFMPYLTIVSMQHADAPSAAKTATLVRDATGAPDRLRIEYALSDEEEARIQRQEKRMRGCLRRVRCMPLKRVYAGHGSSVHYAGTFPMSESPGELRTSPEGLLAGTRAVYLADGSLLPDLPAKVLTLTLMACADRVGTLLAHR